MNRDQVFLPILLLQLVNLFWSFLIWRVLFRMIFGPGLVDSREEGEEEHHTSADEKEAIKGVANGNGSVGKKVEAKGEGKNGGTKEKKKVR